MSVTEHHHNKEEELDEIEIRLSDIIQFLKDSRRSMLIGGFIGLIVGVVYVSSKSDVYTSQVTVMPEIQAKGSGNLSGLGSLAGLAGINIDNLGDQDAIRPDLYPNIIQSVPFALYMLNQPVYSDNLKKQMPLGTYTNVTGKGWLDALTGPDEEGEQTLPRRMPENNQFVKVTKEQDRLVKNVQTSVNAVYDKKTGILSISAVEPEAVVAAKVAQIALDYLTDYIINYRTEKSRRQVNFLRQQVADAKSRYQSTEYALSSYRDNNRSITLNTAKIEEQRLQGDYLLAQSLYNELSKQLEQAKIKVQEETPVFKVLEPPAIPLRKSGPKRTAIVIGFFATSVLLSIGIRLTRYLLSRSTHNQA